MVLRGRAAHGVAAHGAFPVTLVTGICQEVSLNPPNPLPFKDIRETACAKGDPPRPRMNTPLFLNERLVFYNPLFLCLGVLGVCKNLVLPILSEGGYAKQKFEGRGKGQWLAAGFGNRIEKRVSGQPMYFSKKQTRPARRLYSRQSN